ncbi:MAG: YCF48-related protein [Crocinitomicaceae bacterium]|nr:YCF48-related protein [Crocinitomicaceae bacterium]
MRIYLVLLLLAMSKSVSAQSWQQLTGLPSNLNYKNISFLNDANGVISSDQGLFLTSDYGNTWDTIYYNIEDNITDVQFLNDSTILFAGINSVSYGFFAKSTDLGNNWVSTDISANQPDVKLVFTSIDEGHLLSIDQILNTTDGGSTWTNGTFSNTWSFLAGDMFFTSPSTGYIVGYYNAVMYKTIDNGNTWNMMTGMGAGVDVHFPSSQTGYSCDASNNILKTEDAGNNWTEIITGFDELTKLNSVFSPTEDACYSVGENGVIIRTTDGGSSWQDENSGTTENLNSVACTGSYCYVTGNSGVVLRTNNILSIVEPLTDLISIHPNPVDNELIIDAGGLGEYQLTIYSSSGEKVMTCNSPQTIIDVSTLDQGLYIIQIDHADKQITHKFVKK